MCGLHAYNKENDNSTDATNVFSGIPIPDDSTKVSIVSICVGINFIDTWLNIMDYFCVALLCLSREYERNI